MKEFFQMKRVQFAIFMLVIALISKIFELKIPLLMLFGGE